jgi:hypothetical protein
LRKRKSKQKEKNFGESLAKFQRSFPKCNFEFLRKKKKVSSRGSPTAHFAGKIFLGQITSVAKQAFFDCHKRKRSKN